MAEGGVIDANVPGRLRTEDLLQGDGFRLQVFSYHLYPDVSSAAAAGVQPGETTAGLWFEWLSRLERVHDYYMGLRNRL